MDVQFRTQLTIWDHVWYELLLTNSSWQDLVMCPQFITNTVQYRSHLIQVNNGIFQCDSNYWISLCVTSPWEYRSNLNKVKVCIMRTNLHVSQIINNYTEDLKQYILLEGAINRLFEAQWQNQFTDTSKLWINLTIYHTINSVGC